MSESFLVKTSGQFPKLAEAHEWALEHCCQGAPGCAEDDLSLQPMLLISTQRPYVRRADNVLRGARTFVALSADMLGRFYDSFRDDTVRHLDEVVPGESPCKFVLDCDWKVETLGLAGRADEAALKADLDASFAVLVERVVALYAERYNAHVEPCITTASAAGKWSQHVVFDGAIWKSNRHCAALMRELVRDEVAACGGDKTLSLVAQYIDPKIYETNHTLRMYRSSKVGDGERSFRRPDEPLSAPVDKEFLRKSMITLFRVRGGDGEHYYITSVFARRFAERLELTLLEHPNAALVDTAQAVLRGPVASGATRVSKASWTRTFIDAFVNLGAYEAEPELERGSMRLRCLNHECAIKGTRHRNENIFLQIDLIECMWRQSCFNDKCRKTPTEWQALPDHLVELCATVYAQWSGAQLTADLAVYAARIRAL